MAWFVPCVELVVVEALEPSEVCLQQTIVVLLPSLAVLRWPVQFPDLELLLNDGQLQPVVVSDRVALSMTSAPSQSAAL